MADGWTAPPDEARRTFLLVVEAGTDTLLRVLAPFAVQGARIVAAELLEQGARTTIRIEVAGLAMARAEHLAERLRAMPAVRSVGLGWRAGQSAAAAGGLVHTLG